MINNKKPTRKLWVFGLNIARKHSHLPSGLGSVTVMLSSFGLSHSFEMKYIFNYQQNHDNIDVCQLIKWAYKLSLLGHSGS